VETLKENFSGLTITQQENPGKAFQNLTNISEEEEEKVDIEFLEFMECPEDLTEQIKNKNSRNEQLRKLIEAAVLAQTKIKDKPFPEDDKQQQKSSMLPTAAEQTVLNRQKSVTELIASCKKKLESITNLLNDLNDDIPTSKTHARMAENITIKNLMNPRLRKHTKKKQTLLKMVLIRNFILQRNVARSNLSENK